MLAGERRDVIVRFTAQEFELTMGVLVQRPWIEVNALIQKLARMASEQTPESEAPEREY